jgi:AraC family transcriptional regulator
LIQQVIARGEIAQLSRIDVESPHSCDEHVHAESYLEVVLTSNYRQVVEGCAVERQADFSYFMAGNVPHTDHFASATNTLTLEYIRENDNLRLGKRRIGSLESKFLAPIFHKVSNTIRREMSNPDQWSALAVDACAAELMLMILRPPKQQINRCEQPWMHRVLEALQDDSAQHTTIQELATLARVHPTHLSRVFHARFGIPIATFQRQQRLAKAAKALIAGVPTVEVALQAGYAAQSQFTTAFRKAYGITPSRYARQRLT